MNTSRMILVLLACFALQACGGGDAEEEENDKRDTSPPSCETQPNLCQ